MKTTIESRIKQIEKRAGIDVKKPDITVVFVRKNELNGNLECDGWVWKDGNMVLCPQVKEVKKNGYPRGVYFPKCKNCKEV